MSKFLITFCLTAKKPKVFTEQETSRIVGGFDTKGALPYQLELKTRDDFYIYGCGGILISSRFGITADHCIDDTKYLKDAIVWAGAYKDPNGGSVRHSSSTYLRAGSGQSKETPLVIYLAFLA